MYEVSQTRYKYKYTEVYSFLWISENQNMQSYYLKLVLFQKPYLKKLVKYPKQTTKPVQSN